MGNLSGKGYSHKATVYTFKTPEGKLETFTSNAARYDDAMKAAKLPEGTTLVNSSTSNYINENNGKDMYTDNIWIMEGTITKEEATELLDK